MLVICSLSIDISISLLLAVLAEILLLAAILGIVALAAVLRLLLVLSIVTAVCLTRLEGLRCGLERGSTGSESILVWLLLVSEVHLLSLPCQVVVLGGGVILPRVEVRHFVRSFGRRGLRVLRPESK